MNRRNFLFKAAAASITALMPKVSAFQNSVHFSCENITNKLFNYLDDENLNKLISKEPAFLCGGSIVSFLTNYCPARIHLLVSSEILIEIKKYLEINLNNPDATISKFEDTLWTTVYMHGKVLSLAQYADATSKSYIMNDFKHDGLVLQIGKSSLENRFSMSLTEPFIVFSSSDVENTSFTKALRLALRAECDRVSFGMPVDPVINLFYSKILETSRLTIEERLRASALLFISRGTVSGAGGGFLSKLSTSSLGNLLRQSGIQI
jgi:hypothetical protein